MVMTMSCSRWLSTLFEATAHRAVMRKELSEVECHALQHHEVVVDIHRSVDRQDGQDGLHACPRVHISREERRLPSADLADP